ncbi:DUF4214 domain-containing protein [Mesorhizobium sp. M0674]|uniref:DUF4214 domain-containing protein n=1 Tax=unclassified Mesorhizobium TaxID=325217 RepID=UPI0033355F82
MLKCALIGTACLLAMASSAFGDILWGANGHPITAYPGISVERQFDYLEDLGMKSYRVNISDLSSADRLAEIVAEGKKHGIEVLPVITPGNVDLDKDNTDELYAKTRALAVALGSRFKDDIRAWELGNETENYAIIKACEKRDDGTTYPCEWGPAGGTGVLDYFGPRWAKVSAVLKGLSDGMSEVDPGISKAMGTAGWGHTGAFERMKQDGIKWDISIWHMYGQDPEPAFKVLASYGKPIWVTEFNNPYGSRQSERQQAEGLMQSMLRLRQLQAKYNVEAAHIYELLDETYWAPDFEASMGLVRLVGSAERGWSPAGPKAAYIAVRDLILGPRPLPRPERGCDFADSGKIVTATMRQASFSHCLILGRKASDEDIERWSAALDDGSADVPKMMIDLMHSREFLRKYSIIGLSDRAYVGFLYRLLMDRDGDGYGLDVYSKQLRDGSMSRDSIARGMITSSEFTDKYAVHLAATAKTAPAAEMAN